MKIKSIVFLSFIFGFSQQLLIAQNKTDTTTIVSIDYLKKRQLREVLLFNGTLIEDTTKYAFFDNFIQTHKLKIRYVDATEEVQQQIGITKEKVFFKVVEAKKYIIDPKTLNVIKIK